MEAPRLGGHAGGGSGSGSDGCGGWRLASLASFRVGPQGIIIWLTCNSIPILSTCFELDRQAGMQTGGRAD